MQSLTFALYFLQTFIKVGTVTEKFQVERVEPEEVIEEEQGDVAEPDDTEAPPAKKRKLEGHRLPVPDAIISTSKSPHVDLFNVLAVT